MFNDEFYDYYSFASENNYLVNGQVMNQLLIVIMGLIEERPEINERFLVQLVEEMKKCKEYDNDGISLEDLLEQCGLTLEKE